jgi:hypothetical protein
MCVYIYIYVCIYIYIYICICVCICKCCTHTNTPNHTRQDVLVPGMHEDDSYNVMVGNRDIIWLGKRDIIWVGKRDIIWVGKRDIIWVGKRDITAYMWANVTWWVNVTPWHHGGQTWQDASICMAVFVCIHAHVHTLGRKFQCLACTKTIHIMPSWTNVTSCLDWLALCTNGWSNSAKKSMRALLWWVRACVYKYTHLCVCVCVWLLKSTRALLWWVGAMRMLVCISIRICVRVCVCVFDWLRQWGHCCGELEVRAYLYYK